MNCTLTRSWNKYLQRFSHEDMDIYMEESYVRLYETEGEQAVCFLVENGDNCLLFPVLMRDFEYEGKQFRDFETPYGYGGPIVNTADEEFKTSALKHIYEYCRQENFIAGFVRFHPLLHNECGFDAIGNVINDRLTVAVDTNLDVDDIWKNELHSKNRNKIRKAEKAGLTFVADYDFKLLKDFTALYKATMDKLSADSFYYFTDDYYKRFRDTIKDSFIGAVLHDGKVISAAIFFRSALYGHYHLAGSDKEFLHFSPNNFMVWNAALEMKKQGVEKFHLGGGTDSLPDNSLFEFKSIFSKGRYCFSIGKTIFNQPAYDALCADWEKRNAGTDKISKYGRHLLKYKY